MSTAPRPQSSPSATSAGRADSAIAQRRPAAPRRCGRRTSGRASAGRCARRGCRCRACRAREKVTRSQAKPAAARRRDDVERAVVRRRHRGAADEVAGDVERAGHDLDEDRSRVRSRSRGSRATRPCVQAPTGSRRAPCRARRGAVQWAAPMPAAPARAAGRRRTIERPHQPGSAWPRDCTSTRPSAG